MKAWLNFQFLQEIYADADCRDGEGHKEHICPGCQFHCEDPLEETNDKYHDDNFYDLVFKVVETGNLEDGMETAGGPCNIDLRDKQFINAETKDNQDHSDQVKVHRTNDADQDLGMFHFKVRQAHGCLEGVNNLKRA